MSKRAPSGDTVAVRRATQPSTASRTSATIVSATSRGTGIEPVSESTVSAAIPPASVARVRVTPSAGPSPEAAERARPRRSAAQVTTPHVTPTTQAGMLSPTDPASATSSTSWPTSPITGPV